MVGSILFSHISDTHTVIFRVAATTLEVPTPVLLVWRIECCQPALAKFSNEPDTHAIGTTAAIVVVNIAFRRHIERAALKL